MTNIMIPTILTQVLPGAGLDQKAHLPTGNEGSFALHLDRQIREGQLRQENLVGVESKENSIFTDSTRPGQPPLTVHAVLQQLMVDLKGVVDKPGVDPGQWTFQLQNMGLLENLATTAGMSSNDLAPLKKMLEEKGSLPLSDLFNALEKNFKALDAETEVTVPETYLPLLETFLSKLAVPSESIQHLDNQGVNGVDQLDLISYVKGLQELSATRYAQENGTQFVLSPWEMEQFTAMLADAGVPADRIEAMFPERPSLQQKALSGLPAEKGEQSVSMTLKRLQEILEQAVAAVDEARPQADIAGFFSELNTILKQTGFESGAVGWSPVVQGSIRAAYDELKEMVDVAMARVEKGSHTKSVSPEDLIRALRKAISAMRQGRTSEAEDAPGLLTRINAILNQGGLAIAPASGSPSFSGQTVTAQPEDQSTVIDQIPTTLNQDALRQLLLQALSEIAGNTTQPVTLPQPLSQLNAILAQVGLKLNTLQAGSSAQGYNQVPLSTAMSTEEVQKLFAETLTKVHQGQSQKSTLPELLSQVNTVLQPAGLAITTSDLTSIVPEYMVLRKQTAVPLPIKLIADALSPDAVRQLINRALFQLRGDQSQVATLTDLLTRVNTALSPAGLTLSATELESLQITQISLLQTPDPALTSSKDIYELRQLIDQAFTSAQDEQPQTGTVAGLVARINAIIEPAGLVLNAAKVASGQSDNLIAGGPDNNSLSLDEVRQLVNQALSEGAGATEQALPEIITQVNRILESAGLQLTSNDIIPSTKLHEVGQRLLQALSEVSREAQLPEMLAQINAILKPAGVELARDPQNTSDHLHPLVSSIELETLRQLIQQVVAEDGGKPQILLPEIVSRVNSILEPAGLILATVEQETTGAVPLVIQEQPVGQHPTLAVAPLFSHDNLRQLLAEALAEAEGPMLGDRALSELLFTVNETIAPEGFTLVAQSESLGGIQQSLGQAHQAVAEYSPQQNSLSDLCTKVNEALSQAGLKIVPADADQGIETVIASQSAELVTKHFDHALHEGEKITQLKASISEVAERVNAILAPTGLVVTPEVSPQESNQTVDTAISWQRRDSLAAVLEQAVHTLHDYSSQGLATPGLMEKINTILAKAGVAITDTKLQEESNGEVSLLLDNDEVPHTLAPVDFDQTTQQMESLLGDDAPTATLSTTMDGLLETAKEQIHTTLLDTGASAETGTQDQSATDSNRYQQEFDGTKVREEKRAEIMEEKQEVAQEWLASDEELNASEVSPEMTSERPVGTGSGERADSMETVASSNSEARSDHGRGEVGLANKPLEPIHSDPMLKSQPPRFRLSPEMQQFAVEQISQGVLRGLRNNEHHLAMTLYPKELGEVKIDLQVRGNQLSVTFVMENQKVKEAMESNMGEFKDNLERRGFSLGAMSVSVDQHSNQNDGGKRFMATWEQMLVTRQRDGGHMTTPPPSAATTIGNNAIRTPQGGISFFV